MLRFGSVWKHVNRESANWQAGRFWVALIRVRILAPELRSGMERCAKPRLGPLWIGPARLGVEASQCPVAQLAAQATLDRKVPGSNPGEAATGRVGKGKPGRGGTWCWHVMVWTCGCSSTGRARPCHGRGSGFDTRQPLQGSLAQMAERLVEAQDAEVRVLQGPLRSGVE